MLAEAAVADNDRTRARAHGGSTGCGYIGYRGYLENVEPAVPQAIGLELDYPGRAQPKAA
jgi:hypothetical protein